MAEHVLQKRYSHASHPNDRATLLYRRGFAKSSDVTNSKVWGACVNNDATDSNRVIQKPTYILHGFGQYYWPMSLRDHQGGTCSAPGAMGSENISLYKKQGNLTHALCGKLTPYTWLTHALCGRLMYLAHSCIMICGWLMYLALVYIPHVLVHVPVFTPHVSCTWL